MLKKNYLLAMLSLLMLMFTGCLKDKEEEFKVDSKVTGYSINGSKVTFTFNKSMAGSQIAADAVISEVHVAGTMTAWNKSAAGWSMAEKDGVWTLEKTLTEINVPGNCGNPEFKFVVFIKDSTGALKSTWLLPPEDMEIGYKYNNGSKTDLNRVIIFNKSDIETVKENNVKQMTLKTKTTDFATDEELANFRAVETGSLGKGVFFRSYHPFILSKSLNYAELTDIENVRLAKVQELMAKNGVKSVINLSDTATEVTDKANTAYKEMYIAGNVLLSGTDYSKAYFLSNGDDFAKVVKSIGDFVISHEGPYMIHCRLGTDRTGVFTAVLEGLMGATWSEIAADYDKSNNAGFGEYRSPKLLKYSLEHMLGITINDSTVISSNIENYLKTNANILYTDADIALIKSQLSTPKIDKLKGYTITSDSVKFIMTKENFASQLSAGATVTAVNIAGSFNGWNATSTDWKMVQSGVTENFTLEKAQTLVKIPGNSGHPEFKYVITTKEADGTTKTSQWMQPAAGLQDGYRFKQKLTDSNTLVIFAEDNLSEIIADETQAMTIKTTESVFTSVEQITNFRNVKTGNLGDKKLFRSYHPFIPSRTTDADLKDIETLKISKIEGLMAANGIKSIINLSENPVGSTGTVMLKDANGKYYFVYKGANYYANTTYQTALEVGNVLNYETSYNVVYYNSTSDDYAKLMKAVCDFVMTHDAPYMVHCRLGTDRTGTVTGFLEALMGATWGEIAADYSKSNEQGFREFRNAKILKYSFEKMLGTTLTDSTKLDTGIMNFLKTNANIKYTDEQIAAIKAKLSN